MPNSDDPEFQAFLANRERERLVDTIVEKVYGKRYYERENVRKIIEEYERLKNV